MPIDKSKLAVLLMNGGGTPSVPWYLAGGIDSANCIAAYQPKGAASLANSYVNQNNPATHTLTATTAPTLDADGWVFDGTQYLISDITPATNQTWSAIVRFSGQTITGAPERFLFGCLKSNAGFGIAAWTPTAPTGIAYLSGDFATPDIVSPSIAAGVLAISGTKGYRNGIDEGITIGSSAGANSPLTIGAVKGFSIFNYSIGKIQAIAIYNSILTAGQITAVTTAMNNLP